MRLGKLLAIVAVLAAGTAGYRYLRDMSWEENFSPDHEHDVVDGLVGRTAVDQYLDIREKRDQFNLPALKTALTMFYTQHGRYPRTMRELEQSGEAGRDLTRDRHGNPYELDFTAPNQIRLRSAGADRIRGTTDDVEYSLEM